ncbi:hypothetical protein GCM10028785_12990 [Hydrogenophaga soli]
MLSDSVSATLPVTFQATTAAALNLQINPSTVAPNSSGSTTNQAAVQAVARDATGNLVSGQQVNFTLTDTSGGTLSAGTATTDSNGLAQVNYISGAGTSANNGVSITAAMASNAAVNATATLTVSGKALFIKIGFGNTVQVYNASTYSMPFSVYVTDASGAAVANQTVTLSQTAMPQGDGSAYYKGSLSWSAVSSVWVQSITASCLNEDLNLNGVLDSGEDTAVGIANNDGKLTPGGVASLAPSSVTTDSNGIATFNLLYGKNLAWWAKVKITARATVAGTESVQTLPFLLPVLTADVTSQSTTPPNLVSPFGTSAVCTNAL